MSSEGGSEGESDADYLTREALRLANIQANKALLSELQLDGDSLGLATNSTITAALKSKGASKKSTVKKIRQESPVPRRVSARIRGIQAAQDAEETLAAVTTKSKPTLSLKELSWIARHETFDLKALLSGNPGQYFDRQLILKKEDDSQGDLAQSEAIERPRKRAKQEEKDSSSLAESLTQNGDVAGQSSDDEKLDEKTADKRYRDLRALFDELKVQTYDLGELSESKPYVTQGDDEKVLRDAFKDMQLTRVNKVARDRIYSMAFHPATDKTLVFTGDKSGGLGIWDASKANDDRNADMDEADTMGCSWHLQVHAVSALSSIALNLHKPHSIYTASYDRTVRCLNFETGLSEELFTTIETPGTDGPLISALSMTGDGNGLWISDNGGGLTFLDTRAPRKNVRRWEVTNKKIGCVSVHPFDDDFLVTSSLDRTLTWWDSRVLRDIEIGKVNASGFVNYTNDDIAAADPENQRELFSQAYDKSVSSAYFNSTGQLVVATSYDDTIKVYKAPKTGPMSLESSLRHDNQTGRYLTIFKSQWSANPSLPPHYICGNMKKTVEVYSGAGKVIVSLRTPEENPRVPSVAVLHPRLGGLLATGYQSGKCCLWSNQGNE